MASIPTDPLIVDRQQRSLLSTESDKWAISARLGASHDWSRMDGLILVGVAGGFFAVVVAALCAIAYLTGGPGDEDLPATAAVARASQIERP